jgi:DNA (cytosine-5)-methyltransferase 1
MEPIEMTFRYGSVCSGIEAATAAWHHMGWEAAFFSEIEKFPCAVLQHHYPDVPLHGDFTTIRKNEYGKIDLLVGGTPCQSFSVAGLRGGLDDDRGNLALEFCRLAQREQPRWIVWENVPGVLSSNGGRDFGSILGALEDLGYGLAYRVLDAQYFGVAQRRRRVFVVGYLGDWRPAAAVLFERHSMSGHPAPSREKRQEAAGTVAAGTGGSGGNGGARPDLAGPLTAGMHKGPRGTEAVESGHVVTSTFNEDGTARTLTARYDSSPCIDRGPDVVGTLRAHHPGTAGTQSDTDHIVAFSSNMSTPDCQTDGSTPTLKLGGHGGGNPPAVAIDAAHAFKVRGGCEGGGKGYLGSDEVAFTISTHQDQHIFSEGAAYPINTQLGLRGPDVSNTSRDGLGLGGEHDPAYTLQAGHSHAVAYEPAIGWSEELTASVDLAGTIQRGGSGGRHDGVMVPTQTFQPTADCLTAAYGTKWNGNASATNGSLFAQQQSTVRRLTPVECERLQGFPDNFTAIPWRKKGAEDCPDGPRYKALGNSMAVPVMRWIGERIRVVDDYISII